VCNVSSSFQLLNEEHALTHSHIIVSTTERATKIKTRLDLGYCLCIRPLTSPAIPRMLVTVEEQSKNNCEIVDLKSSVMPVVQGFVKTTQQ